MPVLLAKGWGDLLDADSGLMDLRGPPAQRRGGRSFRESRMTSASNTIDKTIDRTLHSMDADHLKALCEAAPQASILASARRRGLGSTLKKLVGGGGSDDVSLDRAVVPRDPLHELLSCLTADGSFKPWPALQHEIRESNRDPAAWRRHLVQTLPGQPKDAAQDDTVLRTALSLVLLARSSPIANRCGAAPPPKPSRTLQRRSGRTSQRCRRGSGK